MKLNNPKKKKSNPHCFDFMLNEQSTFKSMTVGEKSHCGVGIYISIDPHYALIQSGSQVDLGGDVEGLVRCYQSSQLNHPLTITASVLIFSLIFPTDSEENAKLAPAGHAEMYVLFKFKTMNPFFLPTTFEKYCRMNLIKSVWLR